MSDSDYDKDVIESPLTDRYEFDFGRVAQLLGIVKDVAGVCPQFTHLSGEAMAELKEINSELERVQQERADADAAAAQEEAQRQAEERRARAEEEQNPALIDDERRAANAAMNEAAPVPGQPVANPQPSRPAVSQRQLQPAPENIDPMDRDADGIADAQQPAVTTERRV